MAANTFVALDKITASAAATVSFTSIPATYTDLVIVANAKSSVVGSSSNNFRIQFNGDAGVGSLYSNSQMYSDGTLAGSARDASSPVLYMATIGQASAENAYSVINIMNYANTNVFKTVLGRGSHAGSTLQAGAGLWRNTAAINRIDLFMSAATVTGTFTLYGIRAEGVNPAPKATGGMITSDDTYYYHTFAASGAFIPTVSLTADILLVAGGGGGNGGAGGQPGGGGGGGVVLYSNASLSATTYNATVGGGGAYKTSPTINGGPAGNGTATTLGSFGNTVGGGGAGSYSNGSVATATGASGGSGGGGGGIGGSTGSSGGSSTQGSGTGYIGYGFAGGGGSANPLGGCGGGGGGAGGAGANAVPGAASDGVSGGRGGDGYSGNQSWLNAAGLGELVSGTRYLSGGARGDSGPRDGYGGTNKYHGGGANAGNNNGGSGVVSIRYLKV